MTRYTFMAVFVAALSPTIAASQTPWSAISDPDAGSIARVVTDIDDLPPAPSPPVAASLANPYEPLESFTTVARYDDSTRLGSGTGAYQLGFFALEKLGYVRPLQSHPGFGPGNWEYTLWTGKDGVKSRFDFMTRHDIQDRIFGDLLEERLPR